MGMGRWMEFLMSHLWAIPYVVVMVIGLVVSAVNWPKCPRAAALSAVAFLVLLGTVTASIALNFWVEFRDSLGDIGRIYQVFSVVVSLVNAVAYCMLVTAVFIDRPARGMPPKGPLEMGGRDRAL